MIEKVHVAVIAALFIGGIVGFVACLVWGRVEGRADRDAARDAAARHGADIDLDAPFNPVDARELVSRYGREAV